MNKKIKSALISVYYKDHLEEIVHALHAINVTIYSTGGTEIFIKNLGIPVEPVEKITGFPSILGGRVKTLHPAVFGGILARRDMPNDMDTLQQYNIPTIDLVMVDLYPFEETVSEGKSLEEIIEKIDIGGISLIRATAKNYRDTVIISSKQQYPILLDVLKKGGETSLEFRKELSKQAFQVSSHYDTAIYRYFAGDDDFSALKTSITQSTGLRYGENPHQKGIFYGDLSEIFDQLHGKELSYNNLLDVDTGLKLMYDLGNQKPSILILKHNNACGAAQADTLANAWQMALSADPVSAFGGIIISNKPIDLETAQKMNDLFFEILIAPSFDASALELLKGKKNRMLLALKENKIPKTQIRSILNGVLLQTTDLSVESVDQMNPVTDQKPSLSELQDLYFANILCKHTKSNTIVLVKNNQLIASGTGQTSRVDALKQALHKAKAFGFDTQGAVMASDAFFPFPDCVEIAFEAGIHAVVQPGGSIKDQLSIDFCNSKKMAMVFHGIRHFKH